ncbi:hypothetical protein [Desulfosporosinus hippei]|uniref:Uncharacterized protein n=1 Tax=Desulfosporosinus hippei DSM 8344 TaxID=1121419 RepID=A0A1G8CHT5_9FIRM|nr:hypothetical protein [Desulfosporosinus hippei]SDH44968.1 hypothetical protein SAMN05443529_113104 [Desulfosporosinus hippei DSM 8344]
MKSEKKTRTLEEIRKQNKRPNMFFDGMEEKTVELSEKAFQAGRDFFENCVQLTSRHLIKKLQEEMMIKFR